MPIRFPLIGNPVTADDGVPVNADLRYGRAARVSDAIIYVSPTGSDLNSGLSPGQPKLTIAAAITALTPNGGTMELMNGTQTITTKVVSTLSNLRVRGGPGAILRAANALNAIMLEFSGDNIHLEGFTVDGNRGNQTVGNTSSGIHLSNITNSTVRDLTVHDVIAHGILLDNALGAWTDIEITDNVVRNNGDTTNIGNGIVVVAGNRAVVTGNRCISNVGDGIYTQSLADCTVEDNDCRANRGYGIEMSTLIQGCSISNNSCSANTESGIGADGLVTFDDNTISGNTCDVNGGAGIQISAGSGNPNYSTIVGNTCRNNSQPGLIRVDPGVAGNPTVTLTRDGIELSGAQHFVVVANSCYDDQGTMTQRRPISDGGGTTSHVIVANMFPDNGSGGMLLTGSANIVGLNGVTSTSVGGILLSASTSPGAPGLYSSDGLNAILQASNAVQQVFLRPAGATNNNAVLISVGSLGGRLYFMGQAAEVDSYLERSAAGIIASPNAKIVSTPGLGVGNSVAATTPGAVVKKIQIFDTAGNSLGFLPVYSTIT